jgi:hypothetical protein
MTSIENQQLPIVSKDDFQQQLSSLKRNCKDDGKLNSGDISQPSETKFEDSNDSSALPLQKKPKSASEGQSSHEGVLNRPAELPQEVSSKNNESDVKEHRPEISSEEQQSGEFSNSSTGLPQEVSSNSKDSIMKEDKPIIASEGWNDERVSNFPLELPQETSSNIKGSALEEDRPDLASEGKNVEGVVSLPVELPQDVSSNNNHLSEKEWSSDLLKEHQFDDENSPKSSKNGGRKAVEKMCLETGEVIGTFQSVTEAAKSVDVSVAAVRHALRGWKGRKSSAGFGWRYAPPGALPDSAISADHSTEKSADTQEESSQPIIRRRTECRVEQLCVETGEVLQTFNSLREASTRTKLNRKYIRKAFGSVYAGFFWRAEGSIDLPPHSGNETNDSKVLLSTTTIHNPPTLMPLPSNQITTGVSHPRQPLPTDHTTIDTSHPRMPASTGLKLKTTPVSSKSSAKPQTPIDSDKTVRTRANSRYLKTTESQGILPSQSEKKSSKAFAVDGRDTTQVAPEYSPDRFQVGDVVYCNSQRVGKKAEEQKGRIATVHKTGRCDVVFEDGKVS